jgi:secondary thiamine-phosphate synthase enzyme
VCVETTAARGFVDITDDLEAVVARSRVTEGTLTVQTRHTTTAVVVNEHEPLLLEDMLAMLERLAPAAEAYAHDDLSRRTVNLTPRERRNGHAHCQALLLPPSATLVVEGGRLALGRWQRVFLIELDGPQRRELAVTVTGT